MNLGNIIWIDFLAVLTLCFFLLDDIVLKKAVALHPILLDYSTLVVIVIFLLNFNNTLQLTLFIIPNDAEHFVLLLLFDNSTQIIIIIIQQFMNLGIFKAQLYIPNKEGTLVFRRN